jgi:hypothetical protein
MPKIQRQLLSLECFIKPELEQYIAESVRKAVAARFSGVYSGTKTVSNRTGGPYDIVDNGDGTVSTILRTK